jgi:hypothetical protein
LISSEKAHFFLPPLDIIFKSWYFITMHAFGSKTAKTTEKALTRGYNSQAAVSPPPPPPTNKITNKKEKVKKQDRLSTYFIHHSLNPIHSLQNLKNKQTKEKHST